MCPIAVTIAVAIAIAITIAAVAVTIAAVAVTIAAVAITIAAVTVTVTIAVLITGITAHGATFAIIADVAISAIRRDSSTGTVAHCAALAIEVVSVLRTAARYGEQGKEGEAGKDVKPGVFSIHGANSIKASAGRSRPSESASPLSFVNTKVAHTSRPTH